MNHAVDDLFDGAAGVPDGERESWLHERCDDASVVQRVMTLLRADSAASEFLETPPIAAMAEAADGLAKEIGSGCPERVGPYAIERLLGSGGMGEVYLARRVGGDFEQLVAVKLLRGVPTQELTERFARERRVLASLGHPNIAALIDGGETEQGTPYLVMPYVVGEPIDAYCRSRKLDARAIVQLMLPLLDAVGHAHRKLVVHRDLKPANVLVDAEGRPAVLDFGIAKVLRNAGPDVTGSGRQLLTPMYASPEQVRDEPISTATDIFSLGVMLYELLSGQHPWASDRPGPLELARRICDHDPPTPGDVRTLSTAEARQSQRALWDDLDAVIMTALRKEPDRRYASADRFADDLRRALEGRAVTARPDTLSYRASRFIGRHRVAVGGVAVAVVALLSGATVSLWQAGRAEAASHRYFEQLTVTQTRNSQLRSLATTLIFDVYDSVATLDGANPARVALVESGVSYLDELSLQLDDNPELAADLAVDLVRGYVRLADVQGLRTIGSIGNTEGAFASSAKALAIAERLQGMPAAPADAPLLLAMARRAHGDLLRSVGRFDDAIGAYAAGIEAAEQAVVTVPGDPRSYRFVIGLALQQGAVERRVGRSDDAMASYERARRAVTLSLEIDPEHQDTLRDLSILLRREGDLLLEARRVADAKAKFAEGAAILASLAESAPDNRQYASGLSIQYERLGDCALLQNDGFGALEWYTKVHEMVEREVSLNPSDLLAIERLSIALEKLADANASIGDADQAADRAEESKSLAIAAAARDPMNRDLRLDALYIRSKAARMALAAGRSAAEELRAVADAARSTSIENPGDAYPAEIEVESLVALVKYEPAARGSLTEAMARHASRFGRHPWYVSALAAEAE